MSKYWSRYTYLDRLIFGSLQIPPDLMIRKCVFKSQNESSLGRDTLGMLKQYKGSCISGDMGLKSWGRF